MKKTILKDDRGKSLEVDLKEFLDHLNEYNINLGIGFNSAWTFYLFCTV